MKAWLVGIKDEFLKTVVFAENRNKAKSLAKSTEACDGAKYIDIEARRLPIADSQYKGRTEMEWDNPKDRLFLVKNCDFCCEFAELSECDKCSAKKYCSFYQEEKGV
ncbi:MAG: hypothetical protein J1E41_01625 [Ruminococcus sp.]|nr:hypothetical protein [Ruminococcus sp.]